MAKEKLSSIDSEGIPADPSVWNATQVYQWMVWVGKEFGFEASTIKDYNIDGEALSLMSEEDFHNKFTYGTILWTHLDMLRKLTLPSENPTTALPSKEKNLQRRSNLLLNTSAQQIDTEEFNVRLQKSFTDGIRSSPPNCNGGGQIKLWQFLLELLTDADCIDYIRWLGNDGEFKFYNPEIVARKWGERKNKPTMNYEKLSRALRYYYDGNMLSKVGGKRFVYKFVCNLKELIGFSAMELNRQVLDCADKRLSLNQPKNGDEYLHTPSTNDLTLPIIHHGVE